MELVARLLALILVIVTILLVIIVAELGYMIYHKHDNEDSLKDLFHLNKFNDKHHHHREDFNPERNYPKPKDSVFRDEDLPIYYAAGSTELPNDVEHIRDNYYAKNVKPY